MTTDFVATDPRATSRRHTFHPLTVAAVDRLTEEAVAITFAVPEDLRADYTFTAGQHISVRSTELGDEVRRSYSICSAATSGRLRIAVKRLAGGVFSAFALDGLRPGHVLDVLPPSGRFGMAPDPAAARHYCAIAAGSGITPILSIFATLLELEPSSSFTLFYGNRSTASIMFLEELEDLKDRYPQRLQIVHVLSREQQEAELLHGRLDGDRISRLIDAFAPVDTVDEWFLCGPISMIEQARDLLMGRGVVATHIHRELFHTGPAPTPPPAEEVDVGTDAEVTVVLDGRTSSFRVPPNAGSILEAALQVRSDAPYACKNGMCGTCRAKVVDGEVHMDHNYALEDSELAAGFVLACQSHPRSDRVCLDFDA